MGGVGCVYNVLKCDDCSCLRVTFLCRRAPLGDVRGSVWLRLHRRVHCGSLNKLLVACLRLRPNTTSASVVRVAYDDGHFGHDIYGPQLSLVPDAPGGQPQHQQFDDDAWASETCTLTGAGISSSSSTDAIPPMFEYMLGHGSSSDGPPVPVPEECPTREVVGTRVVRCGVVAVALLLVALLD